MSTNNKKALAILRSGLIGFAIVLLSGCANLMDIMPFSKPQVELPQAWPGLPQNAAAASNAEWWKLYHDDSLNALVAEGLEHNHDIALAAARIEEARAQVTLADADEDPTAYATIGPAYNQNSLSDAFVLPRRTRQWDAKLNVSYEVDLWGKLRRATDAARADLLASESAQDTVRNTLTTQLVQGYFAIQALDRQIVVAQRTEETRRDSLKLQQMRLDAGISSEFEVRQLEADLAAVQAEIPALKNQRVQQNNALTVLLGRSPKIMVESAITPANSVAMSDNMVPAGLPSELLLRRPDLREAEQRLMAANGRVAVARAAYYPSITLTGFFGGESQSLGDLFLGPSRIFNFAAQLTQPIFDGKRIGASVKEAQAREDQAIAQYRQAISNAFREVQDALSAQQAAREIQGADSARVTALQKALSLARLRYSNGVSSQLDVLDAERNLLQAEIDFIDAERQQRFAVADLFKAMGGGWQPEPAAVENKAK
jgi:multidrug efflux system outer membrane protein